MTTQALMQAALQAQHERSRTYHTWQRALQDLVGGCLDVSAFQRCMESDIVPAFQTASTTLRAIQDKLHNTSSHDESKSNKDAAMAYLDGWIDQVQRVEKEHYAVSVAMAKAMAAHCVPTSSSSSSSSSSPVATCCVHDRQRCMLYKLLAPQAHGVLCFVTCPDSTTIMDDDEEESESEEEEESDGVQGVKMSVAQHTWTSAEGEFARTYVYNAATVQQRCAMWSAEVMPLVEHRRRLERQARDLTDELQCELSDTYN